MRITYTAKADKQLGSIDHTIAARIVRKIELYAVNPKSLANQVTRLKGSGFLRLRVGDCRVIFSEDGVVLSVLEIGHRRDIYD